MTRKLVVGETIAVCMAWAVSSLDTAMQPLWIPSFIERGIFSTSLTGWIGSSELLLIACSSFAMMLLAGRVNTRSVAIAAAILLMFANVAAASGVPWLVIGGRVLSGLGTGTLQACAIYIVARSANAPRVFALMQLSVLCFVVGIYSGGPILIAAHGPTFLFGLIAVGAALATALLARANLRIEALQQSLQTVQRKWLGSAVCCVGVILISAGVNTPTTYMLVIGKGLGFGEQAVAGVLAVAFSFATLGPVLAHVLADRFGLLKPLLFALAVLTACFVVTLNASSILVMGVGASIQAMACWVFNTYALAFIARLEPSGRVVSAVPAFGMLGAAVGPALGSVLIGFSTRDPLILASMACVAMGWALFAGVGWFGRGPSTSQLVAAL